MEQIDLEILKEFIAESLSNLDTSAISLVNLEKDPSETSHVDAAFRVFHSIKGSCGFFDLDSIKVVAHRMETLLSDVKSKKRAPSSEIVSALLEGVDILKTMLEATAADRTPKPLSSEEQAYLQRLDVILQSGAKTPDERAADLLREIHAARAIVSSADDALKVFPETLAKVEEFLKQLSGAKAALPPTPSSPEPAAATVASGSALAASSKAAAAPGAPSLKKSMRIEESTVDSFMNYTGELISASEMFGYLQEKLDREKVSSGVKNEFKNAITTFHELSQNLQKSLMEIRKLPLKNLFAKYPRMIRDLSVALGKDVVIESTGDDIRIDKSLIELLDDPLVHMIRNSMDHGLETPSARQEAGKPPQGRITVAASIDDSYLYLKIQDDGRGIHPEKIKAVALKKGFITEEQARTMSDSQLVNLIYAPGFSSAEKVTDVSGRGVGMDVVVTNIRKANGTVEIASVPGSGTTISVKLPLTVTTLITKGLVVKAKDEDLIIPLDFVKSVEGVSPSKIFTIQGRGEAILFRGSTLPVIRLTRALGWEDPSAARNSAAASADGSIILVVVESSNTLAAVMIDRLLGIQQVAVKETGAVFRKNPYLAGGAVLRNGRVGLLLNIKTLCQGEIPEGAEATEPAGS